MNIFDKKVEQVNVKQDVSRLHAKFEPKPYYERTKGMAIAARIGAVFLGIVSGITGYLCALEWFGFWYVAVGFLAFVELCKHVSLSKLIATYLPDKTLDMMPLAFASLFLGLSLYTSYAGGTDLPKVTSQLVGEAPTLVDTDSIKNAYAGMISAQESHAQGVKETRSWRGRLADKDGRQVQQAHNEATKLRSELNVKLEVADQKNEAAKTAHEAKLEGRGLSTSIVGLVCDLIICFLIMFIENRDYEHFKLLKAGLPPSPTGSGNAHNNYHNGNDKDYENNTQPQQKQGFASAQNSNNDNRYHYENDNENRSDHSTHTVRTETVVVGMKNCLQCEKPFVSNAKKHIYCSTDCRITNWKSNNRVVGEA